MEILISQVVGAITLTTIAFIFSVDIARCYHQIFVYDPLDESVEDGRA